MDLNQQPRTETMGDEATQVRPEVALTPPQVGEDQEEIWVELNRSTVAMAILKHLEVVVATHQHLGVGVSPLPSLLEVEEVQGETWDDLDLLMGQTMVTTAILTHLEVAVASHQLREVVVASRLHLVVDEA